MQRTVLFVIGILLGLVSSRLEKLLIKDYVDIKEEKKWPIWIAPVFVGIVTVIIGSCYQGYFDLVFIVCLIGIMGFLTIFDLKYMYLPTKIIVTGIVISLIYRCLQAIVWQSYLQLVDSLLGGLIGLSLFCALFYLSKWVLKKDGLGFGDVRLMLFLGLVVEIKGIFLMLILASLMAVIAGGILLVIRKKSEVFPLGPFLCIATFIMMAYGEQLIDLYLKSLGY